MVLLSEKRQGIDTLIFLCESKLLLCYIEYVVKSWLESFRECRTFDIFQGSLEFFLKLKASTGESY